ncbi:hypothetical protein [Rhizobium tumorigenes]|uniref:hypothetical protein n=1 Tax=Rhizobium tumorigenes TaxID=2041385 RepID=UPI00241F28A4|nr:hypothetical protein [Rhizobium tumorigenes]WFS03397.1 hypothetical protein PR016_19035 [Rhizobium tumorigenes]
MLTQISDPVIVGENAHFLATTEEFVWKVKVTPEALVTLTQDRKTPIWSATLYTDILARIADENLTKIDAILDETVWVLEADVLRWLGGQTSRWKAGRDRKHALGGAASSSRPAAVLPLL